MKIYNVLIILLDVVMSVLNRLLGHRLKSSEKKFAKFVVGHRNLLATISSAVNLPRHNQSEPSRLVEGTIWIHASSLGEYGIARPIVSELKRRTSCRIVVTFFSSTGVEALTSSTRYMEEVDDVFYLPLDTPRNVSRFLDIVRPAMAVFMVSELWPNYLLELHRRHIPSYLVSAKINGSSSSMRWYGGILRRALRSFTKILVHDEESCERLAKAGCHDVRIVGNPLFDNVATIARQPYGNEVISAFCKNRRVFIAGSISDENDLTMVATLANRHRDVRFIFVPHEICSGNLRRMKAALEGRSILFSECDDSVDFDKDDIQVLVIDYLGELSRMYRYCAYAYVGGGFTPYLHSLIEASVYGLPVAFGPMTGRKVTPRQLEALGIGRKVRDVEDLERWFMELKDNESKLSAIRLRAVEYVKSNVGAVEDVCRELLGEECHGRG